MPRLAPSRPRARCDFLHAFIVGVCGLVAAPASVYAQPDRKRKPRGGELRVVRDHLRERDRAWRLMLRVRLPSKPKDPEVTLRLRLSQTVDFQPGEGDTPRRVPVDPPRVITHDKVVDMRDVRGDVGLRARTELSLSRDEGYRAGVWVLSVEGPDGPVGRDVELTLEGVNAPDSPPPRGSGERDDGGA